MTDSLTPHNDAWYGVLIEDLKDIIVERNFNANWERIIGKHEIGKRILEDNPNFERKYIYGKEIASAVAESLGVSVRDINRCIKFAKKYPNLQLLPEGKAITWNKIIKEYLPIKKGEENDKNGDTNTTNKSNKSNQGGAISGKIDKNSELNPNFSSPEEYKEWVKTQPCCVCERPPPSDPAHFPVTKDSESEYWVIPLCRECHSLQHRDDLDFCWTYKRKWAKFLFNLILKGG